jgi:hypothetical protein
VTLTQPERFRRSRDAGTYLVLRPKHGKAGAATGARHRKKWRQLQAAYDPMAKAMSTIEHKLNQTLPVFWTMSTILISG